MSTGILDLSTRQKVWVGRILSGAIRGVRRAAGKGPIAQVRRQGLSWELDLREGIDLAIFLGIYEPHLAAGLSKLVRAGDVVLDIGANIGAQTLPLGRLAGASGRVVAVEPTNFAFAKLRRNLALNPQIEPGVTTVQALLSDDPTMFVEAVESSWPVSGDARDLDPVMMGRAQSTSGARTLRLDDLVRELGLARLDFIKMDVDGAEGSVLRGGLETLNRFRPKVVMEFVPHCHEDKPDGFKGFLTFVRSLPYDARTLDGAPVVLHTQSFTYGKGRDLVLWPRN